MERLPVISGNWKMYKTVSEATQFVKDLAPLLKDSQVKVCLAVPFTAIFPTVVEANNLSIDIGAQNMHDATEGAFTGEISAQMLQEAGAKFVILGHSERRALFEEDDAFINRKVLKALNSGLNVTLCVGESAKEHEAQQRDAVLKKQLEAGLAGVPKEMRSKITIAYEPVWAIGTGKAATPELAQEAHAHLRALLAELWGDRDAERTVIQYGGSVKPENTAALYAMRDIDGMLVGGASLSAESFSQIVEACRAKEYLS